MKSVKFFCCGFLSLLILIGSIIPIEAYTGDQPVLYAMYVNDEQVA